MKSTFKMLVLVGGVLSACAAWSDDDTPYLSDSLQLWYRADRGLETNGRPAVRFDGNGHLAAQTAWKAANTLSYTDGAGKSVEYVPGAAWIAVFKSDASGGADGRKNRGAFGLPPTNNDNAKRACLFYASPGTKLAGYLYHSDSRRSASRRATASPSRRRDSTACRRQPTSATPRCSTGASRSTRARRTRMPFRASWS